MIIIRYKGITELEPNTLTYVTIGILDRDDSMFPKWIKELKLCYK